MKTFAKTLAYAVAASAVFLACSDSSSDNSCASASLGKQSASLPAFPVPYDELSPECENEDKKLVRISEMHWEPTDLGGGMSGSMTSGQYGSGTDPVYTLNGEVVSKEEYERRMEEARQTSQEREKRDLDIPCLVGDDAMGWLALLTDAEAEELKEKYGELSIYEYSEPIDMGAGTGANEGTDGSLGSRGCGG